MRPYFRLLDDMTSARRWHLGVARLRNGTEPPLDAGLWFDSSEVPEIAVTHAGLVLDFSLTSFAVPVATKRLANAVRAVAGNDVQCVPVRVGGQTAMVVVNATRVIACLDETRSELIKWTAQDHRSDLAGQYRQVTRLVLDASAIPADAHCFRIDGWLVGLVVSSDVKAAMEAAGCAGATFVQLPT